MIQARNINFTTLSLPYIDYSNKEDIPISDFPFTATKNQFIVIAFNRNSGGGVVFVNGERVGQNNNNEAITTSFMVKAGDIISLSSAGNYHYCNAFDIKWSS